MRESPLYPVLPDRSDAVAPMPAPRAVRDIFASKTKFWGSALVSLLGGWARLSGFDSLCSPINACRRRQRESAEDRATTRADKVRAKLGCLQGVSSSTGQRSKGVCSRTLRNLTARYEAFATDAVNELMLEVQGLSRFAHQKL